MGVVTREQLDPLYEQCVLEMQGKQFRAIWYYLRAWGRKSE
jgi:hypothetical protein